MFRKIRNALLMNEFSHLDLKSVKPQIMEDNRKYCVIWSVFNELFWAYSLIMSLSDPLYHRCRPIYIIAFTICAFTLFLSVYAAPKHDRFIQLIAIVLDAVLLLAGCFIARRLAPQTILVFAAVLIVPVWFIANTLSSILILLINIVTFALIGPRSMEPGIFKWVLSNLIIFSVLGIMLGHFVNKARFERYVFADSNARLAEMQTRNAHHDQLTDLQNRRAYAETIEKFAEEMPPFCLVVIADINGLKEMNDVRGHAAGDELITGAAECLLKSFKGIDTVYRIGGDEFCVIITDEKWDADKSLNRLQELSRNWKGKYISGISISAGYASLKEHPNMDDLLKAADREMYAAKRRHYEKAGMDRRRR